MSREVPDTSQYVTFELTVPKDAEDIIAELGQMASMLHLPARQRPTLPTDLDRSSIPSLWTIGDEQFLHTSRELWQSEDYGMSVNQHLRRVRNSAGLVLWSDGKVNSAIPDSLKDAELDGVPFITYRTNGYTNRKPTGYTLSDEAMLKRAQTLWDHSYFPFIMDASDYRTVFPGINCMRPMASEMTQERLVSYVRANSYDAHALHGTIGKMFDVMNAVAGVVRKDEIGARDVEDEFIEWSALERMMEEAELITRTKNDVKGKLATVIDAQLATGQPYAYGEIVVEGRLDSSLQYDRITLSSLAAIFRSYKSKSETLASRFLKQFT